jgi:DNA replication and repair protein RecF
VQRVEILRIVDLRNYFTAEFRPASGTTVVVGPNGSGKSSLLEAAGLFSTLHSARAASLRVLVRDGAEEGGAQLETADGAPLEVRIKAGRTVMRSGTSPVAAKDFLGRFRSVLFTPEDLDMVRGEPALRRRSLDALGIQLRPRHRSIQRDFERALRQRNAALRDGRPQVAELYSQPLAAAAGPLLDARREIAGALRGPASELYAELAHRGSVGLVYEDSSDAGDRTGAELVEFLHDAYVRTVGSDLERGRTMIGPHRDDIDITLDSRPARWYASRGEQRAITLALRLSELHLLDDAILMLDDVLSELDPERRRRVFDVTTGVQTIVTTTDMESFPASAKVDSRWRVTEGRLEEEAA